MSVADAVRPAGWPSAPGRGCGPSSWSSVPGTSWSTRRSLCSAPWWPKAHLGGAAAWGAIWSAFGVGALGGGLVALHFRPRRPLVAATVATAGFIPLPVLLAAAAPVALTAPVAALGGAGFALCGTLWDTTMQQQVPTEVLSRVSAKGWAGSVASGLRPRRAYGGVDRRPHRLVRSRCRDGAGGHMRTGGAVRARTDRSGAPGTGLITGRCAHAPCVGQDIGSRPDQLAGDDYGGHR